MLHRDCRLRGRHILEAIARIEQYVAGMSFEDFQRNRKTVGAVIRNLEIIGEATGLVPDDVRRYSSDVPWNVMRAVRNVLTHEYDRLNLQVLSETVMPDLPPLSTKL